MQVSKDGRSWRIGTAAEVDWIAGHTTHGLSITTAIPPIFGWRTGHMRGLGAVRYHQDSPATEPRLMSIGGRW